MKKLVVLVVAMAALLGAAPAQAHLAYHQPTNPSLETQLKIQTLNLKHAEYVCKNGGGQHRRWACWASSSVMRDNGQGWLRRIRSETKAALVPPVPTSGGYAPLCGSSCVSCETGGTFNPQIWSPDGKYWGWYQFDYQTWTAHGGGSKEYGNASSSRQTYIASRITYDAWPNC